jgi:hypothetical protein
MAHPDDDIDPPVYGPIVVRRAVYDAGMKLYGSEKAGQTDKCFWEAERKAEECAKAGDKEGAAFWWAVKTFTFEYDVCMDRGTKLVILEEGEIYEPTEENGAE